MKKHITIKVFGKVQGVYFRASTKKKADELNITGFVRNENDGAVYIEAEGEEDALKKFIPWCHEGPAQAQVDYCEIKEEPIQGLLTFMITR